MTDSSRMSKRKGRMKKNNKRKRSAKILLVIVGLLIIYTGKNIYDIWSFSTVDQKCRADVAIILGAAVYTEEPSPVYRERINHGITLYKEGYVDKIIVTGGSPDGSEMSEASVAKKYLLEQGIPDEVVFTEDTSTITQENLENSKVIMDEYGYETAIIVSDPLHMKRAMLLAEDAGIKAYSSPTHTTGIKAYSSPTHTTRYVSLRTKIPFLLRETFYYIGYQWYRLIF